MSSQLCSQGRVVTFTSRRDAYSRLIPNVRSVPARPFSSPSSSRSPSLAFPICTSWGLEGLSASLIDLPNSACFYIALHPMTQTRRLVTCELVPTAFGQKPKACPVLLRCEVWPSPWIQAVTPCPFEVRNIDRCLYNVGTAAESHPCLIGRSCRCDGKKALSRLTYASDLLVRRSDSIERKKPRDLGYVGHHARTVRN